MIQDHDSSSKEALKCMRFLISVFHEGQKKKKKKKKQSNITPVRIYNKSQDLQA